MKTNKIIAIMLTIILLTGIMPMVSASAPPQGKFNRGDIAVINSIIKNNGLSWALAPEDGSMVPADWTGVTWDGNAGLFAYSNNLRIAHLNLSEKNLTGSLDLRELNELSTLNLYKNKLESLDVSGLKLLGKLWCNDNRLTKLDVSGLTDLRTLDCSNNLITSVKLEKGINYDILNVRYNRMEDESAVTGSAVKWDGLRCVFNPQFESKPGMPPQDVSGINQGYSRSDIVVINEIIKNNGLDWTLAPENSSVIPDDWTDIGWQIITTTTLSGSASAQYSTINSSTITVKRLLSLDLSGKNLTGTLVLRDLDALSTLICSDNQLTGIDVKNRTALKRLDCSNNQLTSVALCGDANYTYINVSGNKLESKSAVTGKNIDWDGKSFIFSPQANEKPLEPPPPPKWENPFGDVDEGDAWYDAVAFVYERGLFKGTGADTFSPNGSMTRAMFALVLHRFEGLPAPTGSQNFIDVTDMTYAAAISWAAENGILKGVGGGRFEPDSPVSRQDMATILYRYAVSKGYDVPAKQEMPKYSDFSDISDYAVEPVTKMSEAGVIGEKSGGAFAPKDDATRADVAQAFMGFMMYLAKK